MIPPNLEKEKRTIEVNRIQVLKPSLFESKKIFQFITQKDFLTGDENTVLINSAGK